MRFGLIGCGGIGAIRASAVSRLTGSSLALLSDVDQVRAHSLAKASGGRVVPDWQSLIHSDDVDAVIISTPPALHEEMCIAALAAGKHVLCEKPLARTPSECTAILEAAAVSVGFLATGFNYRFYPSMQRARNLIDSGIIGDIDHIRSYAGYSATGHNPPWVHDVQMMGGGALRDNGIHLIDLTRWFLGEIVEVRGLATSGVWGFPGCEDNGFALLRGSGSRVATLQASWTEWRGYKFLIEIYGTHGCIRTSCFPMRTEWVWSDRPDGKFRRARDLFPRTFLREHLHSYRALVEDSFVAEMNAFTQAAEGGSSQVATGFDGMRAVAIADAASSGLAAHADVRRELELSLSGEK